METSTVLHNEEIIANKKNFLHRRWLFVQWQMCIRDRAGDGDTSELEAQVAQLTKERDAATQLADVSDKKLSDIKAYVAGV